MTDRELLELAAKAAGLIVSHGVDECGESVPMFFDSGDDSGWELDWNPLTDDGDALRLAVKLYLFDSSMFMQFRLEETRANPTRSDMEITRRAIVRAAAEIGKAMK